MTDTTSGLSAAEFIWRAGVAAVDSARLVRASVLRQGSILRIGPQTVDLTTVARIVAIGAGKASAGMARGLESALGNDLVDRCVTGWINVPADCVTPLRRITLHAARPAGRNEPTEEGVVGSRRIRDLVSSLRADDLCLVLLSGGGSALLPLPIPAITLREKQQLTRSLSTHGATIQELNTVRSCLSQLKGGGLVRLASTGRMMALIISDVIGDPLEIIASGPTVCDMEESSAERARRALEIVSRLPAGALPEAVRQELTRQSQATDTAETPARPCFNLIIGNNAVAIRAAAEEAARRGFEVHVTETPQQGQAAELGRALARRCRALRQQITRPVCLIAGGEPVVQLDPHGAGRGGRNQEFALAALCELWNDDLSGVEILSGGTDGEDGPTDAAGARCDGQIRSRAQACHLDPFDALARHDSYSFFAGAKGLLITGPTHTNVMDLQIALVEPAVSGRGG